MKMQNEGSTYICSWDKKWIRACWESAQCRSTRDEKDAKFPNEIAVVVGGGGCGWKGWYSTVQLFYSSLAFGLAILIVPDHLLILLFVLSCVLVFKTIVIRDVLAIVFGLELPYYVLRSLIFINGWDVAAVSSISTTPLNIDGLGGGLMGLIAKYSVYVSFLTVAIFGLMKVSGSYFSDNVEVRRSKLVIILFFIYSLLLLAIHWRELKSFRLLTAFPAAILIAYFFTGEKRYWWKELMGWSLLLALVATLYFV